MGELIDLATRRRISGPREYLRKRDLAEELGVTIRTIERWHALGLPVLRMPGLNLYEMSSVRRWLETFQR